MEKNFIEIAKNAKQASLKIAELNTEIKNSALNKIADFFEAHKTEIFEANKRDLEEAEKLAGILKEKYPDASISIQELGPVIGCHVGPGFLAFVYLSDKESRVA